MWRTRPLCLIVLPLATLVAGCSEGNHVPVLVEQQATIDEDTPIDLEVLDGARDPDGDTLTVTGASASGHHVEVIDHAIVRLTPIKDFHGVIHVDYEVSDGVAAGVTGHAIVTVRSVNDPPIATGGNRNIHGRDAVMLEASDVDGDQLTFAVVANPAHGTLAGNPPALQYTPDAGFIGDDAIMFTVSDGTVTSPPVQVALHVSPGAAPVATAGEVSGDEDHRLAVTLHASDVDGDALTFEVATPPAHGTLDGMPPDLMYTPDPDFHGDDALEFTASDGYLTSDKATLAIHVAPVNDPPVATPQAVAAAEDMPIVITLGGSDVDGDALTFLVDRGPTHGTLSALTGTTLTYTPAHDYHGPDSFTFVASDGRLPVSSSATVDLNVASIDDPPVAMSFARTLNEEAPTQITLVGSDIESDPLSFAIATQPANGVVVGNPPNVTYTPNRDFNGDDSFTYTVSDGTATSEPGTVTLHVTPVNDPPVAINSRVSTDEDTAMDITLQATDVDSSTLTYSIVTQPADGTLTGSGTSWHYVPAHNVNAPRSFRFRVSDDHNATSTATVAITFNPVNDPPTTTDDFVGTDVDTALTFNPASNDNDIDGDSLSLATVDAPASGTAAIVDGKLVYTPNAGFTGVDVFGYTISDGHGATAAGTVHLGVGSFPPGAPLEAISGMGFVLFFSTGLDRKPSVSNDGRYIAFCTPVALVGSDVNGATDVYLYDRSTRSLRLVSADGTGHAGNGSSVAPHLSGNGRYVAFQSNANNLVAGDSNGATDVFRHDRVTGETVRISVASDGTQGNNNSSEPTISDDGNLVAFTSSAFNLIASDANGTFDVFVRDVTAGTTERISVGTSGGDTDLESFDAAISSDGRFVAFTSSATNLVPGDGNAREDVFVRDRVAATTTRVSVSTNGGEASNDSFGPAISRDGRFVSFVSNAINLVPGVSFGSFVYVRDLLSQTTTLPPAPVDPISGDLSGEGRFVASYTFDGLNLTDRFSASSMQPSGTGSWLLPVISDNAKYIVALESANNARLFIMANPLSP